MRHLVWLWLGLPIFGKDSVCSVCRKANNDTMGYHALTCLCEERGIRHNAIRDVILRFGTAAALAPSCEPRPFKVGDARRLDVGFPVWANGRSTYGDIAVVSPLQPSYIKHAVENAGVPLLSTGRSRKTINTNRIWPRLDVSVSPLWWIPLGRGEIPRCHF